MSTLLIITLLLTLTSIGSISYAADFSGMTTNEITEWIMENLPEKKSEAIYENGLGVKGNGSGRMLTSEPPVVVSNYWRVLGTFEGQAWWTADMNQNVTGFGENVCKATPATSDIIGNAEYAGGYLVNSSNARVTLQGEFVDWSDRYSVIQVYNLLGNGTYSYWEYKD